MNDWPVNVVDVDCLYLLSTLLLERLVNDADDGPNAMMYISTLCERQTIKNF